MDKSGDLQLDARFSELPGSRVISNPIPLEFIVEANKLAGVVRISSPRFFAVYCPIMRAPMHGYGGWVATVSRLQELELLDFRRLNRGFGGWVSD